MALRFSRAGQTHANGVETQPATLRDLVFDACIAPAQEALGIAHELGFVHVADVDVLAKALDLLGIGHVADHVLVFLGLREALDALLKTIEEVIDDERAAMRAGGEVLELFHAPCA